MKKSSFLDNFVWGMFTLIGTIFLIVGVFICIFLFNNKGKIETTATITQIESYRDSGRKLKHEVYVAYEVDGVPYESRLNFYSSSMYEGKEISIYYKEDNPNKISANTPEILLFLIFPALGLIFSAIGGIGLTRNYKKNKKYQELKETGEVIYAEYTQLDMNTTYSMNGKHPYNIICEWNNPDDGKKYIFKSGNIWRNPQSIIEERGITQFPIYIDRHDIRNYLVDTDMLFKDVVDLT